MNCMKVLIKIKLYFQNVGPTKDASFYEYMDSKERFNELRDNRITYDEALKATRVVKKIYEVKMANKTPEQKK